MSHGRTHFSEDRKVSQSPRNGRNYSKDDNVNQLSREKKSSKHVDQEKHLETIDEVPTEEQEASNSQPQRTGSTKESLSQKVLEIKSSEEKEELLTQEITESKDKERYHKTPVLRKTVTLEESEKSTEELPAPPEPPPRPVTKHHRKGTSSKESLTDEQPDNDTQPEPEVESSREAQNWEIVDKPLPIFKPASNKDLLERDNKLSSTTWAQLTKEQPKEPEIEEPPQQKPGVAGRRSSTIRPSLILTVLEEPEVIEVIEELPILARMHSRPEVSRGERRYSRVIGELEAQKERRKSVLHGKTEEKEYNYSIDVEGKRIRFSVDRDSSRDNIVNGIAQGMRMRLEHRACPKSCESFLNVEQFSPLFVDEIIEESLAKGEIIRKASSTVFIEGIQYKEEDEEESKSSLSIPSIGTYVCILEWPTIEEFTVEVGATKILEYFSYWQFEEEWKYCVNYLKGESDSTCDFHRYEAIFSIPCKQYPIPQATASIYFTYEVSRVKPKECLVDVYFSFEGQRFVQTPGQFKLQETWLFYIIDAKIKFFKTLKF